MSGSPWEAQSADSSSPRELAGRLPNDGACQLRSKSALLCPDLPAHFWTGTDSADSAAAWIGAAVVAATMATCIVLHRLSTSLASNARSDRRRQHKTLQFAAFLARVELATSHPSFSFTVER